MGVCVEAGKAMEYSLTFQQIWGCSGLVCTPLCKVWDPHFAKTAPLTYFFPPPAIASLRLSKPFSVQGWRFSHRSVLSKGGGGRETHGHVCGQEAWSCECNIQAPCVGPPASLAGAFWCLQTFVFLTQDPAKIQGGASEGARL